MRCIKEERDIEKRCTEFLQTFAKEVHSKMDTMQGEIEELKKQFRSRADPINTDENIKLRVVNEVCTNVNERIARQNNIVVLKRG